MPGPLTLTFAEIDFVLSARPQRIDEVRGQLRLEPVAPSRDVLAAGLASLLARGLCTMPEAEVVPGDDLVPVAAALSTFTEHAEAVGWRGDETLVLHVFNGPSVRLAVYPRPYGQFTVDLIDPAEALSAQVIRFLDAVAGAPRSGMVVRSTRDGATIGVAVAVDANGTWFVSDSEDSPDRGVPASHDAAVRRISAVLGSAPVGADR